VSLELRPTVFVVRKGEAREQLFRATVRGDGISPSAEIIIQDGERQWRTPIPAVRPGPGGVVVTLGLPRTLAPGRSRLGWPRTAVP